MNKVISSEQFIATLKQNIKWPDMDALARTTIEEVLAEMPQVSTVKWGMSYEVIQMVLHAEAADLMVQGKFEGARALCDMADYFGIVIPKKIEEALHEAEKV